MPPKPNLPFHDVNPFFQRIREFLLGRKVVLALRFKDMLASRSPPPPVLPDGPAHKLSSNYYFTRDGRREAGQPEVIASSTQQIEGGRSGAEVKRITPGKTWKWD